MKFKKFFWKIFFKSSVQQSVKIPLLGENDAKGPKRSSSSSSLPLPPSIKHNVRIYFLMNPHYAPRYRRPSVHGQKWRERS